MKAIPTTLALLFVLVSQVVTSPVPSKHSKSTEKERILYDQRQEGEWNIRADLKNFVILIIPKTSEAPENSSDLLDLLTRSHSKHHHGKHGVKKLPGGNEAGAETMHFIESKTAPYHVDITKSSSHLMNDEILATQSPPVNSVSLKTIENKKSKKEEGSEPIMTSAAALLRQLRSTRFSKAFVLNVPDEEFVLTKMEDDKKVVKKDGFKKKSEKKNKDEMSLLGAAEQCGPDMSRDAEGICRLKKVVELSDENDTSVDRNE